MTVKAAVVEAEVMIAAVVNAVEVTIVVNSLKRVVNQIAVVNPNINVASGILCWKNSPLD